MAEMNSGSLGLRWTSLMRKAKNVASSPAARWRKYHISERNRTAKYVIPNKGFKGIIQTSYFILGYDIEFRDFNIRALDQPVTDIYSYLNKSMQYTSKNYDKDKIGKSFPP